MADLADRVVVITGAASGIGRAAAALCGAAGARLVLVDCNSDALANTAASLDCEVATIVADVGDHDTASHYVETAVSRFGQIDIGLLNAGVAGRVARIDAVTAEEFDRIMAVNVRSVWSGMAALFPVMKANGGGSIVVTASTGGILGAPMVVPYIASKHAVIGLVKASAIEGARFGIRVNAVAPAPIDTDMMSQINQGLGAGDSEKSRQRTIAHVPLQRYGTALEVAKTIVFLGSDDAAYTTGATYLIDGGMSAGVYP